MHVLMLANEFPPARGYGLARYAGELASALASMNHAVDVVTCNYNGGRPGRERGGARIHDRRELWPLHHYDWTGDIVLDNVYLVERGLDIVDESGPVDVIISHDWHAAHAAKSLSSILGVPWLLFMHDTEPGKRGNTLTRQQLYIAQMEGWAIGHAARVICCSRFMRDELESRYNCPADKIAVISPGVNPTSFEVDADFRAFRQFLAPDDKRIVLFVGRLSPMKGPDLLVEAIPAVLERLPRTNFVFCGDGILARTLAEKCERLGVDGSARFLGHLYGKTLAAVYRVSDLLVVPSRYEPFGMAALEGVVCGLRVLVANSGGLAEIAEREPRTALFGELTVDAIAAACARAGFEPSGSYPNELRSPRPEHCWETVARRVSELLQEIMIR